ncbi:hypothetical protein CRYUN_Cryun40dG0024400 [Craigia yunnanensis]
MGGNGATGFFLNFAILAAVVGIVSEFAGGHHISSGYGPGYRDADCGIRAPGDEPVPKADPAVAGSS